MGLDLTTVQPISVDEIDSIVILDRLCFGGLWSIDSYRREMTNENSHFLGVSIDKTLEPETSGIIGFGCFWAILDEAHITLLGVHPQYQRQGLGKLLLGALLDKARSIEMARATLEVRASNQGAIDLYERFGFQTVGRRKKYYQDTGEDGVIMWRGGLQHPNFTHLVNNPVV
ncbi:ribosomal protein S18-alanine N-acetyltransferase [Chamaesiphon sp. OTE_75_metabat_556]|uniref:ribosomal protein S18-alanine N-acetyltransferase n=1 Tax=Chamaesiphon sp. OTE_75_metabat_556 TaxID=2964692 RepID=UPI00286B6576|nr:ribosomal protein S18-alanine N-acetyltransferase [Chamaesiphon sp. OTE_75_metabat_556]